MSAAGSERHVELKTTMGTCVLELYTHHAPRTVENFIRLTTRGYYDGVTFHRIIRDFMIQGGDPTGTGRGGQSSFEGGKPFEDELHPGLKHTGAGILSMANSGPNTNTSQFFVTLAPTPHLDGKHTIFGRVCDGMDVIKRIGTVQTDRNDRPVTDVTILSARVVP